MKPKPNKSSEFDRLKRQVRHLSNEPGVYLMRDSTGTVIYVGKAKDLRARVSNYFGVGDGRYQLPRLLAKVHEFETIVTQSEEQAFVLERDLITKHKPRFNIRLKDDKAYLLIRVDRNAQWPRLELVRKRREDGAEYFGPYVFSGELKGLLDIVKRVIPLRTCPDTVLYNRARPCLEYQIKRCCAPCCLAVEPDYYSELVNQACGILEGKGAATVKHLKDQMGRASEELRFEDAAAWRDRLDMLETFRAGAGVVSFRGDASDVFAIFRNEEVASVCVVNVRSGRIADSKGFSLSDLVVSDGELLEGLLSDYYSGNREIPPEIMVPMEFENLAVVEQGLTERRGEKVSIIAPKRGSKAQLLAIAELNARQHYTQSLTVESQWNTVGAALSTKLALKQVPRRIECIDISNFQGTDIVGALVAFTDGVAEKSAYRRYNIKGVQTQDDFASVHEVVSRRLRSGIENGDLPDLLVIDGGLGQLSMALQARDEQRLDIEIVALAKSRTFGELEAEEVRRSPERLFREGDSEPIVLPSGDPVTRFLARIRDEVHRFVITFHRKKRSERSFKSVLDTIGGLTAERKRRLFKEFGSIEVMKSQAPAELARAGRMPLSLANKVMTVLMKQ